MGKNFWVVIDVSDLPQPPEITLQATEIHKWWWIPIDQLFAMPPHLELNRATIRVVDSARGKEVVGEVVGKVVHISSPRDPRNKNFSIRPS